MTKAEREQALEVLKGLRRKLQELQAGRKKAKESGVPEQGLGKWDALIKEVDDAIAKIKNHLGDDDDQLSAALEAGRRALTKAQRFWAAAQAAEALEMEPSGMKQPGPELEL